MLTGVHFLHMSLRFFRISEVNNTVWRPSWDGWPALCLRGQGDTQENKPNLKKQALLNSPKSLFIRGILFSHSLSTFTHFFRFNRKCKKISLFLSIFQSFYLYSLYLKNKNERERRRNKWRGILQLLFHFSDARNKSELGQQKRAQNFHGVSVTVRAPTTSLSLYFYLQSVHRQQRASIWTSPRTDAGVRMSPCYRCRLCHHFLNTHASDKWAMPQT